MDAKYRPLVALAGGSVLGVRGDSRVARFDPDPMRLAWAVALEGRVLYRTLRPVVSGAVISIPYEGEGSRPGVLSLAVDSGAVLARAFDYEPGAVLGGLGSSASSADHAAHLFETERGSVLFVVNAKTQRVWSRTLSTRDQARRLDLVRGLVVVQGFDTLALFDVTNGEPRGQWSVDGPGCVADDALLMSTLGELHEIDLATLEVRRLGAAPPGGLLDGCGRRGETWWLRLSGADGRRLVKLAPDGSVRHRLVLSSTVSPAGEQEAADFFVPERSALHGALARFLPVMHENADGGTQLAWIDLDAAAPVLVDDAASRTAARVARWGSRYVTIARDTTLSLWDGASLTPIAAPKSGVGDAVVSGGYIWFGGAEGMSCQAIDAASSGAGPAGAR